MINSFFPYPSPQKLETSLCTTSFSHPSPVVNMNTLLSSRYKENLPCRSFTKHKNGLKFPTSLNSRQWVFLRKGLDDFKKGCPPCTGLATQFPEEGFLPRIYHRAPQLDPKKRQIKLPKEADLLSKLLPAQQARKAFLEDVEARLTPHPLALHPNLEEAMPVELLLSVLEVLDLDQKLKDTWAYCQGARKGMKESTKLLKQCSTQVYLGPSKKTSVSNSDQWLYEENPHKVDLPHENSLRLHENVRKAVSDFCCWVTTFGSSAIDEEFILKQFDVDYQTKPSHDALHMVRLNQVPVELKHSMGLSKPQEPEFFQKPGYERKLQKPQNLCNPTWVKMRYRAWSLNPKLWKKQRADEPLVDPEVPHKAQEENFKKKLEEQFLENMYIGKECKHACIKSPIKRTQA
uniref:Family with sequence similarity 47 member E n=1 Tax=Callithrix jacchus TaxID=9483 RepID=F7ISV8_CALJA